ncbi:hypothetical protein [Halorubrum halophilum]|uniref:hypothetical protein n=1 Tax=Halorubrum halophilum TaxID=413816 RepID=UPI000678E63D|nr:hypothetical protein [Halorubrum halophilum]
MQREESTDGNDRNGVRFDVDWLLSRVITFLVGWMAVALFGQVFSDYSLTIFLWGMLASHTFQRSVSLENREDGREELVFRWPWDDTADET